MTSVLPTSVAGHRVDPPHDPSSAEPTAGADGSATVGSPRWSRLRGAPVLWSTLIGLLGLALVVAGDALGWSGVAYVPTVLLYLGLVVLLAPSAAVLLGPGASSEQRQASVIVLGLLMYGAWVAGNPIYFSAFDETLHVRTLVDLTSGGGFFAPNTMLPVSPHYPGLELATAAVHWLTGLPLVTCGIVVVACSRVALVLALFHLAARMCGSARAGGIVVLLYAASLQFYFFNAQFSYQTVALAMILGLLWFLLQAVQATTRRGTVVPMVCCQLCIGALAVSHHVSSWIGLGGLWGLALLFVVGRERRRARLTLITAGLATCVIGAWSTIVLPLLRGYLGPVFAEAGTQIDNLLNSDGGGRQVLSGSGGNATPYWESAVMAVTVLLFCLALLPAGLSALRGRTVTRSLTRVMLVGVALTFPTLFLLRFVPTAAEIGERASTFVALAVALVVGGWLVRRVDAIGLSVAVPMIVVMIIGGVILGSGPDWQRVPGPYLPGAEQRSVDGETMAVAEWAGRYLPTGSRFASDVTFSRILPTVAPVDAVTGTGGSVNMTELFISTGLGTYTTGLIEQGDVDFVVVDTRLIGHTVLSGAYFEGSNGFGPSAVTLTARQLDKFQDAPGYDLVLDGPVRVYDVRGLRGLPETYVDRPYPGLPGSWSPVQVAIVGVGLLLALGAAGRRRWRVPGSVASTNRTVLALPALMLVGAVGVVVGFSPVSGTLLGLAALGLAVRHARATGAHDGAPARADLGPVPLRRWLPWTATLSTLLVVLTVVASLSAYHGLFSHAPLPAPTTTSTSAGATSGTSGTSTGPP